MTKNSKPKLATQNGRNLNGTQFYRNMAVDVLARTLWGEARGQGNEGLAAVAHVVLNRVRIAEQRGGYWWGGDIIQVCQKPYQFSCWNRSDPNFQKLSAVDDRNADFRTCLKLARRAIGGTLGKDFTHGATHYHADYVNPYWAKGEEPLTIIGNHLFYRLEEV